MASLVSRLSSESLENISYCVCQIPSASDEDRYSVNLSHFKSNVQSEGEIPQAISSFSVFDGHGGRYSSNFCMNILNESVVRKYCILVNNATSPAPSCQLNSSEVTDKLLCEAIKLAYEQVDRQLRNECDDGTTAVSLFVIALPDGSNRILCPWVGDSRCVLYRTNLESKKIEYLRMTQDHKPNLRREVDRIEKNSPVLWTGIPYEVTQEDNMTSNSYPQIINIPKGNIVQIDFEQDNHVDERPEQISEAELTMNHHIEKPKLFVHSFIERRSSHNSPQNPMKLGPLAVFSQYGVSISMTRTLGDRYGPRSCIWVPDISATTIPPNQHARFVLASDGLWDVISVEDLQELVFRWKDVRKVAAVITKRAWLKRAHLSIRPDDITVLVVDINPEAYIDPMTGITCGGPCRMS